jgi:hypothetical protein
MPKEYDSHFQNVFNSMLEFSLAFSEVKYTKKFCVNKIDVKCIMPFSFEGYSLLGCDAM